METHEGTGNQTESLKLLSQLLETNQTAKADDLLRFVNTHHRDFLQSAAQLYKKHHRPPPPGLLPATKPRWDLFERIWDSLRTRPGTWFAALLATAVIALAIYAAV